MQLWHGITLDDRNRSVTIIQVCMGECIAACLQDIVNDYHIYFYELDTEHQ